MPGATALDLQHARLRHRRPRAHRGGRRARARRTGQLLRHARPRARRGSRRRAVLRGDVRARGWLAALADDDVVRARSTAAGGSPGSKAFCSGAGHADGYLVVAGRTDESGHRSISQFLVPADVGGIIVEPTWDSLGMRATASHDLHLDVTVDDDALVGGIEDLGVLLAQAMPQWLVASYAAVYVGVAQSALDAARRLRAGAWPRPAAAGTGPARARRRRGRRRPRGRTGSGPPRRRGAG